MGRKKNPVPTYRRHKGKGLAYCTINGQAVYLGAWDSPESKQAYARLVAELRASPAAAVRREGVTVSEVVTAFGQHALAHYRRADGTSTNEVREYDYLLTPVLSLYGDTPAADFGPAALKACRAEYLRLGWARTTVNNRVRRLKHVFKWAAGEELGPGLDRVPAALANVGGLQKGRTKAREPEPVGPVDPAHVEATLTRLGPVPAAMVRVMQLTGCRPQDVCGMRPADMDTAGPVWVFRPGQHKTAWRGKPRAVAVGPRAQAILKAWEPSDPTAYYFDPRRAVELRNQRRRGERKTPLYPSHEAHLARKRKAEPKRTPAAQYTSHALCVAVGRAAVLAGVPEWHPNQIRHAHGQIVRDRYGLEATQAVLGHENAKTSELYAATSLDLAKQVAAEIG